MQIADYLPKILEKTSNIIVVIDTNQNILYANDSYRNLIGEQKSLREVFDEKQLKEISEAIETIEENDEPQILDLNYTTGSEKWFSTEIVKIDKNKYYLRGHDITQLKHSQVDLLAKNKELENTKQAILNLLEDMNETKRSLENANRKLRELDKLKNEFISIASHELRTPMTSIKGYLSMILEEETEVEKLSKETLDFIEEAYSSNEQLIELVNDMLDVTKIERGRLMLDIREVKAKDLIESAVNTMKPIAKEDGDELITDIRIEESVIVKADPTRMSQVVRNLLDNAIKFTEKGTITLTAEKSGEKLKVSVTDTGIGMSEDEMENLFEKFYQLRAGLARPKGGTGLGLYISKNLLEAMDGSISVKSKPDVGSTFMFTLPLSNKT